MGRVLDARAVSPWGLFVTRAKPGDGRQPPDGGPEGHALTCGALNTESITSLQTEENKSETQTTRAG